MTKKMEKVKFFIDGKDYLFEKGVHPNGSPVLIARYIYNGEGFAIFTADILSLPESKEEAEFILSNYGWEPTSW